jgi:ribosome biogenesis protein UTP30
MSELDLNKSKVLTAVEGLKRVADQVKKTDILDDDVDLIQLQICVKKIPPKDHTVKLKMPHSIRQPNMEVCLFVKDLDRFDRDYDPTVNHFKDLLRKKGINIITEVVPLKSLKTEYKPYEAKRNLANAYDIFLADARIVRLLPTYLGKHFYGKKK